MKDNLKKIAKSYDKSIIQGRKGIDKYKSLPKSITNDPDYALYQKFYQLNPSSDSARSVVYDFLNPKKGMRFIDLGCCLNLMFAGYRDWDSDYYGVDISNETIKLLNEYVLNENLSVGGLYCAGMHKMPFDDCYFDICACIGSLEYFESQYVEQVINEINRIVKNDGRIVLDIPHIGSPEAKIAGMIEKYLGREDRFDMTLINFENLLNKFFYIAKKEKYGPMMEYFLIKK